MSIVLLSVPSKMNFVPAQLVNPNLTNVANKVVSKIGNVSKGKVHNNYLQHKVILSFGEKVALKKDSVSFSYSSNFNPVVNNKKQNRVNHHYDKFALAKYFDNYGEKEEKLDRLKERQDWFERVEEKELQKQDEERKELATNWVDFYTSPYSSFSQQTQNELDLQAALIEYHSEHGKDNLANLGEERLEYQYKKNKNNKDDLVKKFILEQFIYNK